MSEQPRAVPTQADPQTHLQALEQLLASARRNEADIEARWDAARQRTASLVLAVEQARERAARSANLALRDGIWREAARRLDVFSVKELAAELGVSPGRARHKLLQFLEEETVEPAGRGLGQQMYRYVREQDDAARERIEGDQ